MELLWNGVAMLWNGAAMEWSCYRGLCEWTYRDLANLQSFSDPLPLLHQYALKTSSITNIPVSTIALGSFFALALMHVILNPAMILMGSLTRALRVAMLMARVLQLPRLYCIYSRLAYMKLVPVLCLLGVCATVCRLDHYARARVQSDLGHLHCLWYLCWLRQHSSGMLASGAQTIQDDSSEEPAKRKIQELSCARTARRSCTEWVSCPTVARRRVTCTWIPGRASIARLRSTAGEREREAAQGSAAR